MCVCVCVYVRASENVVCEYAIAYTSATAHSLIQFSILVRLFLLMPTLHS